MAKQSKRAAYHAQTKRENSLLKRALLQEQQAHGRATALVLGMLVQAGGDITFSQATTLKMNQEIARMGYQIRPDAEGRVVVGLVMQEPVLQTEQEKVALGAQAMEAASGKSSIVLTD